MAKRQLQFLAVLAGMLSCMPEPALRPVTQLVGPEGGRVVAENGITVDIPSGALTSETPITISTAHSLPDGAVIAAEIGPTGTQFEKPITLSFPSDVTSAAPETLKVMTVIAGQWLALPDWSYDAVTGLVSGTTTHLSPYGLVRSSELCANEADDDGDALTDCEDPVCWGHPSCNEPIDGGTDGGAGKKCNFDKHCPNGEVCIDRVCTLPSPDGGDLADGGIDPIDAGEPFDAGEPLDAGDRTCRNNNQCPDLHVCIDGVCVPSGLDGGTVRCESDAECPTGMRCRGFDCK